MRKTTSILTNENGSIIAVALLIMVLLMIIGISATTTSVTELQIVRNEAIYKQNFYGAESAAIEGAQTLINTSNSNLNDRTFTLFTWLKGSGTHDMTDTANWDNNINSAASTIEPNSAMYSVIEEGIVPGNSLDISAPNNLYDYTIRGLSESNNGRVLIEMGYKKRH